MPKRVKSHFYCLTVIGVERKMVSVLRRRKKYAAGTSSTPSNVYTSCTLPSVNNIPSAESLESAPPTPLIRPSNSKLQTESNQPNQSSSAGKK